MENLMLGASVGDLLGLVARMENIINHMYARVITSVKTICGVKFRSFTSSVMQRSVPNSPVNSSHLLKICTILYQQQNSSDQKLYSHLSSCNFDLSHEFFLQVCNKFPYSWKPVYRFFMFTKAQLTFSHSSVSYNKLIDIFGKSRNINLLWTFLNEMAKEKLVTDKTFLIAVKTLASVREMKRSVEIFHLMNSHGYSYSIKTLNKVVEMLCKSKLVEEAKYMVFKIKPWIEPSVITYRFLIMGYSSTGDLVEASKIWNLMEDQGFDLDIDSGEIMIDTLFKHNRSDDALKLFLSIKEQKVEELGGSTYRVLIKWLCKQRKISHAQALFDEMLKRGIELDNQTIASLIYGTLSVGKVREAHKIMGTVITPDLCLYHGVIKGLLKLKRPSEATQVFREMCERGCEPIMHTYIMLLQGHLGKRGRKGPNPEVNFESIFVGGLIKMGKSLEATKYLERTMNSGIRVPRFDYNRFLYYYSNEEGVVMFEEVGKRLREVGLIDLADIFTRYGEKMATRDRRRGLIHVQQM